MTDSSIAEKSKEVLYKIQKFGIKYSKSDLQSLLLISFYQNIFLLNHFFSSYFSCQDI